MVLHTRYSNSSTPMIRPGPGCVSGNIPQSCMQMRTYCMAPVGVANPVFQPMKSFPMSCSPVIVMFTCHAHWPTTIKVPAVPFRKQAYCMAPLGVVNPCFRLHEIMFHYMPTSHCHAHCHFHADLHSSRSPINNYFDYDSVLHVTY